MKRANISAFVAGLLFSLGLLFSQMVNPEKVLNFLDIFGQWDPSLLLVMSSALLVYWIGYFVIQPKLAAPLCSEKYDLPSNKQIDARLIWGAVLFGTGWGLTGLCPGPAIANIAGGEPKLLVFIVVLTLSIVIFDRLMLSKK